MDISTYTEPLQRGFAWAPPWVFSLVVLTLAVIVALAAHELIVRIVRGSLRRHSADAFWRPLVVRTRAPGRLALIVVALGAAAPAAPLSPGLTRLVQHGLLIAFIVLVGWAVLTALDIAAALYMRRYRIDVSDNLVARKHLTQIRILRRAAATLVVVTTVAFALMTIGAVRQWGVSLLAAGGAAGLIVGLALQPLLSNLMAGIQIAMTQPIRIDDAVIVENEWGKIEEINATYVVVALWDWRRLVLPLTYFIQNPFQNWTRESAALIGTAMIYVDYSAPVEAMRAKLEEIARESPLWDGQVVNLAVTDLREQVMEVRCLASARDAGATFDLRTHVREQMVRFLQTEHPYALPRTRIDFGGGELAAQRQAGGEAPRPRPQ